MQVKSGILIAKGIYNLLNLLINLIIIFILLTHEYMVKMINKKENLDCCADTADDGVIVWGDTSPISGRVKMGHAAHFFSNLFCGKFTGRLIILFLIAKIYLCCSINEHSLFGIRYSAIFTSRYLFLFLYCLVFPSSTAMFPLQYAF